MHMQGDPRTMQHAPTYEDVVGEVREHLVARAEAARDAGVDELWIDPGFGFGKDLRHNLELLAHLDELVATGFPVAVGISRKGFLGRLLAASDQRASAPALPGLVGVGIGDDTTPVPVDDRLEGSLATATWAAVQGVRLIRAHDVLATVHAVELVGDMRAGRSGVMAKLRGKWAQGIQPRNFAWIIKDHLAVCERPGRLRREPPPGAPPGGDHLDPRAGLRLRDLDHPVAPQPAQLRRARRHVPAPSLQRRRRPPDRTSRRSTPSSTSCSPAARRSSCTARSWATGSSAWSAATSAGPAWCTDGPQSISIIERISGSSSTRFGRSLVELAGRLSPDRR